MSAGTRQQGPLLAVQRGMIDHLRARDTDGVYYAIMPDTAEYPYVIYDGYIAERWSTKECEGWDGVIRLSAYGQGEGRHVSRAITMLDDAIEALCSGTLSITGYTVVAIQCDRLLPVERDLDSRIARITAEFRLRIEEN